MLEGDGEVRRINRKELTRKEIIRVAANCFLKDGYSKTTINAICKTLKMSPGNLTFHFPTKEHLLAELVGMLCKYQQKMMEEELKEGYSSVMVVCLEFLTIASACEQDEIAKEFFLASYTSPLSLERIRKSDIERAKVVFRDYCLEWTEEKFEAAETLVSGIEYATLQTTSTSATLELRIREALDLILNLYHVPAEIRQQTIEKILSLNYK